MTSAGRLGRSVVPDLLMERYRPEEPLGIGGSAEVWRGVDERLGRPVAIKVLHAHLLRDAVARERFEREARAAAALSHPGIVRVYDVEATPDGAAIILELVEGETLAERLAREGPLPAPEVARIGAELAEALAHAHERGVVHRDVKPGNVLLDPDGRARLVDFGIARVLDGEAAQLTTAGMVAGTLRYLAPEQLAGSAATTASDLYALGAVLYEMAAGRPAFGSPTPVALATAQRTLPEDPPGVPPDLAAVWHAALDPEPARRPTSAAAMDADLRALAATPIRDRVDPRTGVDGRRPRAGKASSPNHGFAGSDTATLVVAPPVLATPGARDARRAAGTEPPGTPAVEIGASLRGLVAARSAWLTGVLAAIVVTAMIVLAMTALGSGSTLLAPAGGLGDSAAPSATTVAAPTPAATSAQPAGGGNGGPGHDNAKGKGKGGGHD